MAELCLREDGPNYVKIFNIDLNHVLELNKKGHVLIMTNGLNTLYTDTDNNVYNYFDKNDANGPVERLNNTIKLAKLTRNGIKKMHKIDTKNLDAKHIAKQLKTFDMKRHNLEKLFMYFDLKNKGYVVNQEENNVIKFLRIVYEEWDV